MSGYVQRPWQSRCQVMAVAALIANAAVRPTFTEVGHLTALILGLAGVPLAPDRERMTYPSAATTARLRRLREYVRSIRAGLCRAVRERSSR